MECNKDEAMRARLIAEKKMSNNEFELALKTAEKAQNLYPELENITQLISICEVHCSAKKPIPGNDKDWYGILKVAQFADELAIKKQYRKLALSLHPDKNRFPGAEAAFKLICEANAVLSDPTKKSLYDRKIKVTARTAPPPAAKAQPHHMNSNSQFNKQYVPQNNVYNGFSSMNQQQATQQSFSVNPEKFYTSCPFCSLRYQCDRKYVNTNLHCQKCSKNFMGFEVTAQGNPVFTWAPPNAQPAPSRPSASQSTVFQEKVVLKQGEFAKPSASYVGSWSKASRKTVPEPVVRAQNNNKGINVETAAKAEGDLKAKETGNSNFNSWKGGKESQTSNGYAHNRETRDLKNKHRKRGRKHVVESSESSDSSSESDLEDVTTNMNSGHVHYPRRSSRKRQNVSYNEGDDDEPISNLKRSQGSKPLEEEKDGLDGKGSNHENQNGFHTEKGTAHPKKEKNEEVKANGEVGPDTIEIESDSDQDSFSGDNSDTTICQCDDPEFNDFDKYREESSFAVNQFWALYDTTDGMPRFYAKVTKVCAEPFELTIKWLEAQSTNEAEDKWIKEELPVGCGSFVLGKSEKTTRRLTFSHQVACDKGKKRGSLIIYPKKGEVWALFKDWDINWSSNPENHREFKYEVVEVVSDFVGGSGIAVSYLDKIKGFVSLFQRISQSEANSFVIGPNELYKFSHQISSFRMRGSEREGVPVGSFELDPASLPVNPDDLFYPGKMPNAS